MSVTPHSLSAALSENRKPSLTYSAIDITYRLREVLNETSVDTRKFGFSVLLGLIRLTLILLLLLEIGAIFAVFSTLTPTTAGNPTVHHLTAGRQLTAATQSE